MENGSLGSHIHCGAHSVVLLSFLMVRFKHKLWQLCFEPYILQFASVLQSLVRGHLLGASAAKTSCELNRVIPSNFINIFHPLKIRSFITS